MICPPLTITFLGTGTSSGVPMIGCHCAVCTSTDVKNNRLRSSILVQSATTTFVIDTTPDFRQQMLREKVEKLDAVLFTHPHKDHVAGLDDIRAYNYFQKKPMQIFANLITHEALKREFPYAFEKHKHAGLPDLELITIEAGINFKIGDIPITPILVWHLNMPVLGFRIGYFTYITDANKINKTEINKILATKVLVINALRKEKHISHFSLSEAIEVVEKTKATQAYFTHISHQLGLHQQITNELPPNIQLAFDGLKLQIA